MVEDKKLEVNAPTKYQIIIKDCGTDTFSFTYKKLENKNPIKLGLSVVNIMAKDFAGDENAYKYYYWLACAILKGFEIDKDKLLEDINNVQSMVEKLDLKVVE
jgi:hypothetical protein